MSEVWPFEPEGLSVQLSWFTSVVPTFSTEQRAKLRLLYPRARFKITSTLEEDDTFLARRIAERAEGEYTVPDWRFASFVPGVFDFNNLSIPVDDNFFYPEAGDLALAWKSLSEFYLVTIASRGANSLTATAGPGEALEGFYIMPAQPAYAQGGVRIDHDTNNVNQVTLDLETRTYKDLASFAPSYPTFQTYEVNTDRDLFVGKHDAAVLKAVSYVDGQTGKVALEEVYDHVDLSTTFSAKDQGSANMIAREGWIHKRGGRLVPFWKPTWGSDLILQAGALAGATELSAELNAPAVEYIGKRFVVDQEGSFQFFEVGNAYTDGGGYGSAYGVAYGAATTGTTLTLELTAGLSADIDLAKVRTISEMNLVRLDADEVDFKYNPGIISQLNVPLSGLDNDL